jgi:hypothetical protein
MDCNIYCLVDATGHVYVKDGATSHAEVAANFGLDAHGCEAYRFDLAARQLLVDAASRPAIARCGPTGIGTSALPTSSWPLPRKVA